MKVKDIREIPLPKVRDLLEMRQRLGPLESYQVAALSHASRFSKIPSDKAEELVEELIDKFKVSRATAVQIANVLPTSVQELRVLLAREGKIFLTEDLEKILELIRSHIE
ncbi:MAG: RNA polymerase Rpb4 family protein [Candidatus Nezhaarchaeota archaeon]|nr:RNA polymerase Rpb4 family protein [Candidatus Nezhaarchaeota archaeon]